MKKVIVTGGLGFVGTALVKELVKDENIEKILVLDNLLSGSVNNEVDNEKVVYHIVGVEHIGMFSGDYDTLFHLGEYSRVEQSFEDFSLVHQNNTNGMREVLEFCRKKNCKLIYSGSSTKFSAETEDGKAGFQQSPYAFTKYMNTELIKSYSDWYGLNYAIAYFYNVYGPGELSEGKYATVIAKFKKHHEKREAIPVVLPGTQKRNFTHIEDTVAGLIKIAEHGSGDGYGIGSDEAFSIEEVAKLFQDDVTYLPERKGNRLSARVVTEKTKALGWEAKHSLSEYIKSVKVF